jgi:hypothetical protein
MVAGGLGVKYDLMMAIMVSMLSNIVICATISHSSVRASNVKSEDSHVRVMVPFGLIQVVVFSSSAAIFLEFPVPVVKRADRSGFEPS